MMNFFLLQSEFQEGFRVKKLDLFVLWNSPSNSQDGLLYAFLNLNEYQL